jgi:hypothetical protein
VCLQLGLEHRRDGDGADAGVGLRWTEDVRAVLELLVLLDHLDPPVQQVDPITGERQHLAEAQSDERADEHHRPEPGRW